MWQVIGQTRAVSLLERGLKGGSLAHAYLLLGLPHVGKMTLALNLAQALNCESAEPPCGVCPSCQKVELGKHTDVQVIGLVPGKESEKLQTEISIEQIRDMQHSANLPPFEGRYKVFIIDGAELMSIEAANSLLKILEEPPAKVVFILLTTNQSLLPVTIVSRCQRVEVIPVAVADVAEALNKKWGVEPGRAKLLARLSRGLVGWSVAAARDESLLRQREEWLAELHEIIDGDYEERFASASKLATIFSQGRETVQHRLDLWLDWWRDLMLVKVGCDDFVTNIDRSDILTQMSKNYTLAQTKAVIDGVRTAKIQFQRNANPRLVLETLMLDLPEVKYG
ncbi:MAG: DNA polymerase III subunit delta' [Chloroflexota bacterium]